MVGRVLKRNPVASMRQCVNQCVCCVVVGQGLKRKSGYLALRTKPGCFIEEICQSLCLISCS